MSLAGELAGCPCCDTAAHIFPHSTIETVRFYMACEHCGLRTLTYSSEAEAIAAWNTRAPTPEAEALKVAREALGDVAGVSFPSMSGDVVAAFRRQTAEAALAAINNLMGEGK